MVLLLPYVVKVSLMTYIFINFIFFLYIFLNQNTVCNYSVSILFNSLFEYSSNYFSSTSSNYIYHLFLHNSNNMLKVIINTINVITIAINNV